ncbi:MAG: inositol monophosphatase family protein [Gammaproteobacteria bacterium]|nr:inositol monophosphatase family protein [Gammaproteobacteria bacterium]
MNIQLPELVALVTEIAKRELLPRFAKVSHSHKQDGSLLTEADIETQRAVTEALQARWPEVQLLGEEMDHEAQEQLMESGDQALWILDPLDGTSNFAAGIPYFALSLALLRDGQLELGIVYDPVRDECFTAKRGEGAWLNGEPLSGDVPIPALKESMAIVDFKRLPKPLASRLASEAPYRSQRSFGGVALDWCWLAANRIHVYLHGKQNIWDYAAGYLVCSETGGHGCTLEGEPLFEASLTPKSAVGALSEETFQQWCQWLEVNPPE